MQDFERWLEALESKGFKISHTKTKYIKFANLEGMCKEVKLLRKLNLKRYHKEIHYDTLAQ